MIITYTGKSLLPFPNIGFTDSLKAILEKYENSKNSKLEDLKNSIRQCMIDRRRGAPNFKIDDWYLMILNNELSIRFGHSGEPQIIVTEEEVETI